MGFSAWLEVYLGDRWPTIDARHNEPRIGRVLMGRGRDAVDVALTTSFGSTTLTGFTVWTDPLPASARWSRRLKAASPPPSPAPPPPPPPSSCPPTPHPPHPSS